MLYLPEFEMITLLEPFYFNTYRDDARGDYWWQVDANLYPVDTQVYTVPENESVIPDGQLFALTEPFSTLYEDGKLILNFADPLSASQVKRFERMLRTTILSVKTCEKALTVYTGTSFSIEFRVFATLEADRESIRQLASRFLEYEPSIPVQVSLF
jgi:hypothetical protein